MFHISAGNTPNILAKVAGETVVSATATENRTEVTFSQSI